MDFIETPSPNFNDRALPVSMLVLHYTGMKSGAEALTRLVDPEAGVSAHYVVEEDGRIFRLVAEENRAWHAGKSWWRGISDVNSASIGIEIVNPGHEFGYRAFPPEQMESVLRLTEGIVKRHDIPRANVVGHSCVAPARKEDPGELFDWPLLARHRLAIEVPEKLGAPPDWGDASFLLALERYGYDIAEPEKAIIAFQRRFRPSRLDGVADGECRAILFGLLLERDAGRAR